MATGEGDELEIEVSQEMVSLGKTNLPIYITVSQVLNFVTHLMSQLHVQVGDMCLVVDTSLEEASCISCRIMVAVNEDKHLCGFVKEGRGGISAASLGDALTVRHTTTLAYLFLCYIHCSLLKMSVVML